MGLPGLPTPGDAGTNGTWGTTLNTVLNDAFQIKRKASAESILNTTLQNDDEFFLPVLANGVYLVEWDLRIDGSTTGDFKYSWTGPSAATMIWSSQGHDVTAATNVAPIVQDAPLISTVISHGTLGVSTFTHVRGNGVMIVDTTAGNLQLQWAQNTTDAGNATRVNIRSWLKAQRVS